MKRSLKVFRVLMAIIIVAGAVLWLIYPRQSLPNDEIDTIEAMEAYFDQITQEGFPPSMNVSVMKDGVLVYDQGFGDSASTANVYAYWSITKVYTAVAVLSLYEDGFLDLDDPISQYLEDFETVDKDGKPVTITVRQMLEHQSGLKELQGEIVQLIHLQSEEGMGVTKVYQNHIRDRYDQVTFQPGTETRYTNTAYIVLAALIEGITEGSYQDYVEGRIIEPLALTETSFELEDAFLDNAVQPSNPVINHFTLLLRLFADRNFNDDYVLRSENGRQWFRHFYTEYKGSTGLFGTSKDLAFFGQSLLDDLNGMGHVLDQESIESMFGQHGREDLTDTIKNEDFAIGLKAWKIDDKVVYGHAGGGAGYGAALAIMPEEDWVIAVLANDTNIRRDKILEIIYRATCQSSP